MPGAVLRREPGGGFFLHVRDGSQPAAGMCGDRPRVDIADAAGAKKTNVEHAVFPHLRLRRTAGGDQISCGL
jgi:hypothetical protein